MKYIVEIYFGEGGVDINVKEDKVDARYVGYKEQDELMERFEKQQPYYVMWTDQGLNLHYTLVKEIY